MTHKLLIFAMSISLFLGCATGKGSVDNFSASPDNIPGIGKGIILSCIIRDEDTGKNVFGPVIVEKTHNGGRQASMTSRLFEMPPTFECNGTKLEYGSVYEYYDNSVHFIGTVDYGKIPNPINVDNLEIEVIRLFGIYHHENK